jgi:hypothetical protein
MKLFLDTGDVDAVKRANDTGLLDGVTTNPTHVSQRPGVDSSRWCRRSVPLCPPRSRRSHGFYLDTPSGR